MTNVRKEPSAKSLSGLHLLLTYECDHCFVWGGPSQVGTMIPETVEHIIEQAKALGTIEWIYFEGREAFLYYDCSLPAYTSCSDSRSDVRSRLTGACQS